MPNLKLENWRKSDTTERQRERERERERERGERERQRERVKCRKREEKTEQRFVYHRTEDRRGRRFAETVASNTKISNTDKDKTNRLLSTG